MVTKKSVGFKVGINVQEQKHKTKDNGDAANYVNLMNEVDKYGKQLYEKSKIFGRV